MSPALRKKCSYLIPSQNNPFALATMYMTLSRRRLTESANVGRLTDLGAIFHETRKKLFAWYFHAISISYGIGKCAESIAMMIYYSQCTSSSLSSQYSLQESILKIKFSRSPKIGGRQYCGTV